MQNNTQIIDKEDLKEKIQQLINEKYPLIEKVILFGSYSRGDMDEKSDIDLFISKPDRVPAEYVLCLIEDLRNLYNKNIDLFSGVDVDKKSNFYNSIMSEGSVVYAR